MEDQNKKPEEQQGFTYEQENRDDPYANVRRESEPYTFGPFGPSQAYGAGKEPHSDSSITEVVPSATREYRPFTVSGGAPRSEWGAKPPRRTSFRAMFASFLVGVVVLGGLLCAADRGNWFSSEFLGGTAQVQNTSITPTGTAVSNTTDVVRPNNIAKIFEQSSPAVVKIETYASAQQNDGGGMMNDDFFRQFFGDQLPNGGNGNGGGSSGGTDSLQPSGMGS
jgi:serine protease Do